MSVVRLELTVPDDEAYDIADTLVRKHLGTLGERAANVTVDVRTDAEALRDRTILRAASYFMPGGAR